jgi:zinc transporter ZupT
MLVWRRRCGCCCVVVCFLLLELLRRHSIATNHSYGAEASEAQVVRALGWSMLSGLATGVGGAVVFCLEPPQPGKQGGTAPAVSNRAMGALLGAAVGVMMVLSADMILPRVPRYGLPAALPIAAGIGTIYMLDALISWFELSADFGAGGGHGHSHGALLPLKREDDRRRGRGEGARADADAAARARSALLTGLALAAHNAPEGLAVGATTHPEG